jgi:hypothetical protein
MPYVFATEANYTHNRYILYNPTELMASFQVLDGKTMTGKMVSIYRDGKVMRVNREFKGTVILVGGVPEVDILEPNPMKALGLPLPSPALVVVYKYEEEEKGVVREFPIAEGVILRCGPTSYFEEEIKRILKEEESGIVLEGTVFHDRLQGLDLTMREAFSLFQQESFPHVKTSCRKVIERIKQISSGWKTVDNSESLADKFKGIITSVYSFLSIGGAHEGPSSREETEFILKSTLACLLYVNSLLKSERISESGKNEQTKAPGGKGQAES